MVTFVIACVIAYLLGSISTAIITAKFMKQPDPRSVGSQNAGATNVLRQSGFSSAAIVLIGDVLKGFIAVMFGALIGVSGMMLGFVALSAVVGHVFPVFFQFKGGKGVATALGAIFVLSWHIAILCLITWAFVAFIFRYASLASMAAIVAAPIGSMLFLMPEYIIPTFLIALLVIWKHQENIARIKQGTETRIEFRK